MTDVHGNAIRDRRFARVLWLSLLILVFAVWWGGLTFYAVIVVPIGTEQIGSTDQGFITQEVTRWHNALLTAMAAGLLLDAWLRRCRRLGIVAAVLAAIDAALFFEHSVLTEMMDFTNRAVEDEFYPRHAVYLWLTTAEWAIGFALIVVSGLSNAGDNQTETMRRELTSTGG